MFRLIPALGAVLFALVGLAACGGSSGIPGDAVAKVGGTPITNTAFKHWIGVAAISGASGALAEKPVAPEPPAYTACIEHLKTIAAKELKGKALPSTASLKKQCETQYKSLTQEVLSFLLSSQWVIEEAKTLGVKVSDAEVKKQFQTIKRSQFTKPGEFEKFLTSSGQSVSDLLLRVKLNLLSTKIQAKVAKEKASPSSAQIEKYYNENKSRYGTPEKRNVEIILTKTQAAAAKAKQEIQSGKSFSSVAKAVSIDPASKANGGLISGVVKGQEVKALDSAIFSSSKGVLTGPVSTPFGFYVLEVTGVTPGKEESLSQARASIKAQLTASQQQEALSKFVKEFKAKWKAQTDCRKGFVVADCKQYKAPKTTGSTEAG